MPGEDTIRKTEDGKYILKVKGEEREVTEEELFKMAQLAEGANKRFEQAAEFEKKSGELSRTIESLKQAYLLADQGDPEAFDQFLAGIGVGESTRKQKVEAFAKFWEQLRSGSTGDEEEEEEPVTRKTTKQDPAELPEIPLDKLPKPLRQTLEALGEKRFLKLMARLDREDRESDANRIYTEVFGDLEKDKVLSKIMSDKASPRTQVLQERAKEMIRDRIRAGGEYGPELRASVVKDLADFVEKFGAGSSSPTPIPGLGIGPSLSGIDTQADKTPERVALGEDGYDDRAVQRLAHMVLREG